MMVCSLCVNSLHKINFGKKIDTCTLCVHVGIYIYIYNFFFPRGGRGVKQWHTEPHVQPFLFEINKKIIFKTATTSVVVGSYQVMYIMLYKSCVYTMYMCYENDMHCTCSLCRC